MAIISFALTTKEFLSGKKTVTRRDWDDHHYLRWCAWYDAGKRTHQAWDKVPYAGGKRIGTFELTCRPYRETLATMPIGDLEAEGGMCKSREEFCALIGMGPEDVVTVIRFKKINDVHT